jgi:hypothetical protein
MQISVIARFLIMTVFVLITVGGEHATAGDEKRFLYQWTDGQGNIGVADDLTKVPPQYRAGAKRMQQPGAADAGPDSREMRQQAPAEEQVDSGSAADADEIKKAEWQQRVHDAKRRAEAAESRLSDLERRKSELTAQWGGAGSALPPQHVLDEIAKIEADKAQARRDVDKANEEVNVTIPDQARKAGIPPGWLREVQ